ncbi:hypothetical protein FQN54_003970 [Arachnomyces sp. PD_36]|nr:hypothetical protein FQN54_003970 [Arachnomyces sp. PD_36]
MSSTVEGFRNEANSSLLNRPASYNHLPSLNRPSDPDIKRTFSEHNLPLSAESAARLEKDNVATGKDILRRSSLRSSGDKAKRSGFTLPSEENDDATTNKPEVVNGGDNAKADSQPPKARSVSGALANLARKPWMASRSPSPSSKGARRKAGRTRDSSPTRTDTSTLKPGSPSKPARHARTPSESRPELMRRGSVLSKKSSRPLNILTSSKGKPEPDNIPKSPSTHSLRGRASFERFTSAFGNSTSDVPPVPQPPVGTLQPPSTESSRKKDELWGVFRNLDADYQKFQSKSSALKPNVMRSTLLPFLSRYAHHPSTQNLRPEDLDRRINILNKWWTGLLEVLSGRNNQSVSGTDRPDYLEAVVGLMTRQEWMIPPYSSSTSTVNLANPSKQVATSRSNTSLESTGSDFLVESIYHNIRNIFVQNLLSQMAFVVDRMSMRHAPASLVAFCGKACAYAFYFCPGVADTLARLWNPSPTILRRVLAECEVHRGSNMKSISENIASNFPHPIRSVGFTSHAALIRYLRLPINPPIGAANIPWNGPWVSRWSGRDTELFFVFTKHFHILLAEFLPSGLDKSKRICAPGLLSVHAQLLVVLENTLYKQSTPQPAENSHGATSTTFDDFVDEADTSAAVLPLGAANALRSMSENRLIILLRDLLSENSDESSSVRQLYAESFCGLLKTAARKTSVFDHNTCFVLCDFLEEVVEIISHYCLVTQQQDLLDWKFWLSVSKEMTQSHNSLTTVRVFSFLFNSWSIITDTEERREGFCFGLLLHEDFFFSFFNHWSPMVRSYFHRLLCWRVARYDGEPSPLNLRIYNTLAARLGNIWSYYLTTQSQAEKGISPALSSAPCTPAPGRRIIIIKNEAAPPRNNLFLTFDRLAPLNSTVQQTSYTNHGSMRGLLSNGASSDSQPPKKRWNILKTMFSSPSNPRPGEVTPPGSSSEESEQNPLDDVSSADNNHEKGAEDQTALDDTQKPRTPHQTFSFRFSLEWLDRPQWPTKNRRLFPPPLPVPAQLVLQSQRARAAASDQDKHEPNNWNPTNATPSSDLPKEKICSPEEISPPDLVNKSLVASKYAGRALAEWAMVVSECDNFFERRRDEGVPSNHLVEIPSLGVENFRNG